MRRNIKRSLFPLGFLIIVILTITCVIATPMNELPMYGGMKKTEQQKAADEHFIQEVVAKSGSREKGSRVASKAGWEAYYEGDLNMSMKRFNQAWLLDDKNAEAYWGFGLVLMKKQQYQQGLEMLEKAYTLAPNNARLIADLAYQYSEESRGYLLIKNKQDEERLRKADELFKRASQLDPDYAMIYGQWAISKYYHRDYKDAWEKVQKARELGGSGTLSSSFLKDLGKKMPDPYGK